MRRNREETSAVNQNKKSSSANVPWWSNVLSVVVLLLGLILCFGTGWSQASITAFAAGGSAVLYLRERLKKG